jgi:hypothetical protein
MRGLFPLADVPEIAAGSMQLQPMDGRSRAGAVAALGNAARSGDAVWVARDAISAMPRAYVALINSERAPELRSAPGLSGDTDDAQAAADVVRRFAKSALGLTV